MSRIDILYRSVYNIEVDEKSGVKQTILNEALGLFSAKGYEGVSVNELTEAAGITKPTLYYYFGSKEGLFEVVCQTNYTRLNALIAKNAVYRPRPESYFQDIFGTLSKITKVYFSYAKENEIFYRTVLANLSMPQSSSVFGIVKKYHFTQFDVIESMFRDMSETHGNLKGKSKTLAWSFIGTINSYISLFFSGIYANSLNEKIVRELVQQFMHGIYA
jgi:AcrR family transcriptional regulator